MFAIRVLCPLRTTIGYEKELCCATDYHGDDRTNPAFIVRAKDDDRALFQMLSWEPALPFAFQSFLSTPFTSINASFQDRSYRNIDWRFIPASDTNPSQGVGYGLFRATHLLIIATDEDAMKIIIDRLFKTTP